MAGLMIDQYAMWWPTSNFSIVALFYVFDVYTSALYNRNESGLFEFTWFITSIVAGFHWSIWII